MSSVNSFDALGDETRRKLLDHLYAQAGQSVTELAVRMGISRQAVDKQLKILIAAELVIARRIGRDRRHYLNPLAFRKSAMRWLKKFEGVKLKDLAPE